MARLLDIGGGVVIDVDKQLLELDRTDYEDSLYAFLRAAWRYIDPSPWQDGWAVGAICEHLQAVVDGEIRRLIINVPPRTAKSTTLAVAFPAWCWAQPETSHTAGPGVQFLFASYAEKLSLRDSIKCRRLIRSSWYQQLWGDRFALNADQDTAHRFSTDKGGERLITSIGGTATGEGAAIFAIDDANAANEATSEATITATNDWWDQTASTRLNNPKLGAYIVTQQRLSEDDLTGHILEASVGEWTHLVLPMHYERARSFVTVIGWEDPRTEEGELLWPERFGEEEVKLLERTLGPWGACGQLEQRPEPKGGGVIKREWWLTWEEAAFPPMDYIMASLDTAYTEKTENDFSALTVWGVFTTDTVATPNRTFDADGRPVNFSRHFTDPAPRVMLMGAWNERLAFHDLVQKTIETCRKMKVDRLIIESKAAGISTAQEIQRLCSFDDFSVFLSDPKSIDKLSRLYSIQHLFAPEMREKRDVFGAPMKDPRGNVIMETARDGIVYAPDRAWADQVITQCAVFPHGKHDDLVDTVSQALRYLRTTGMLTLAPERLAEIEEAKQYTRPELPLYPA